MENFGKNNKDEECIKLFTTKKLELATIYSITNAYSIILMSR